MFPFMLFIFFCFFGVLLILYHMLRMQERHFRLLQEEHAQMRVLIRAMESRLDALQTESPNEKNADTTEGSIRRHIIHPVQRPTDDSLLHLSFEAPPEAQKKDSALDIHFEPARDRT